MSDHLERLEEWVQFRNGTAPSPYANSYDGVARDATALCAECRRLRADVDFYRHAFDHDVTDDSGKWEAGFEAGAARQLAEVLGLVSSEDVVRHKAPEAGLTRSHIREAIKALGLVRPPLPAERLAEENARMREALAAWLRQAGVTRSDGLGLLILNHDIARLVTLSREATGEAPA